MRNLIKIILVLFLAFAQEAFSQDPQMSMYYAMPLYISPSFAGSAYNSRLMLNHRQQWPGNQSKYSTFFTSFDTYFAKQKVGLGLVSMYDEQGSGMYFDRFNTIRTMDLTLQAAYDITLNKNYSLRPGLQLHGVNRRIGTNYLYPNQLNNQGLNGQPSGEVLNDNSFFYPSVGSGVLLYGKDFWMGVAGHHLNRPNTSFLPGGNVRTDIKLNFHVGYKYYFFKGSRTSHYLSDEVEYSISPIVHYKMQGRNDQLDIGFAGTADQFLYGFWYRGLPYLKNYNNSNINNESLIFMVGWVFEGWNLHYAYDFTISKLVQSTQGAHEINLAYIFRKKKSKFKYKRLPCPTHIRYMKHDGINYQHDHDGRN
ncbi:MAG: PorP/SprF family type IX secretion system membrane protein [Cytophagales bacterium]